MPFLDEKSIRRIVPLGMLLITLVCYWKIRTHEFVNYDDSTFVSGNTYLTDGFSWIGIKWALFSNHFLSGVEKADYWAPVPYLSHMLDFQIYGPTPYGHHLTNLWIHLLNTFILLRLLYRMTGAYWRSACVAALFALHPLNVQSVAWIVERKGLLGTLFSLLCLYTYKSYCEKKTFKNYLLTLGFCGLALMSKSTFVFLPLLLLLVDYWPLKRLSRINRRELFPLILEKIPFFLFSLLEAIQTFLYMKNAHALVAESKWPFFVRLVHVFHNYALYLYKILIPKDFSVFYPHEGISLNLSLAFVCVGLVSLISVRSIYWIKSYPYFFTGWLWFVVGLIPVIGIVQAGGQSIGDRYAYFPTIGIFILLAWGGNAFLENLPKFLKNQGFLVKKISIGIFIFWILFLGYRTSAETQYWKNSITLFSHALQSTREDNMIAHTNLGAALREVGELKESEKHLKKAVELDPGFSIAHFNLGLTLFDEKKYRAALTHLFISYKIEPRTAEALYYAGNIYYDLGQIDKALVFYQKAVENKPLMASAYYNMGHIYYDRGNFDQALEMYSRALKTDPDAEALFNMGLTFAQKGNMENAIKFFKAALEFDPKFEKAKVALEQINHSSQIQTTP